MMWEEIKEWWEAQYLINLKKQPRCNGCGKFMSKKFDKEAYLILGAETYHMREKCITNGVKKLRAKNPNWNWPMKEK